MICYRRDALLAIFTTRCEKDCLNNLFGNNYCRYFNYLKPSTALCMARTSDLQNFNSGPSAVRGLPMAAMLVWGDHLWQPYSVWGNRLWEDHQWHDRTFLATSRVMTRLEQMPCVISGKWHISSHGNNNSHSIFLNFTCKNLRVTMYGVPVYHVCVHEVIIELYRI